MIHKNAFLDTKSLEEALCFVGGYKLDISKRKFLLKQGAMTGVVAAEYDHLGCTKRIGTYDRITQDFIQRTSYDMAKHATILDVGCGSGLLSIELAAQTRANVLGIDCSPDMIELAIKNRNNIRHPSSYAIGNSQLGKGQVMTDIDKWIESVTKQKVKFIQMDIHSIVELKDVMPLEYIICRNVLHRFYDPVVRNPPCLAISRMYHTLPPGGKLYIRDIHRDADWEILKERIGEQRWNSLSLVEDYVRAMASMLTIAELEKYLGQLMIEDYTITDGSYLGPKIKSRGNLNEFEKETEYVCVIRKPQG